MATFAEIVGKRIEQIRASGINLSRASLVGKEVRKHGVSYTSELGRILALPRRQWESDPAIAEITKEMTLMLRAPGGGEKCSPTCECPRELWPNQAVSLLECATVHGLFGPSGVGRGKALISVLAPVVMRAERPLLLVPAQLRDQTNRKVLPTLWRHWTLHPKLRVLGYSELSLPKNKEILFDLNPDLIVLDEAHSAKNRGSARTKRLIEYLKEYPLTRVVILSGTMTRRSIRDYDHLLRWALKPDRCPLPSEWTEVKDWADALDEGIEPQDRLAPGALMTLCDGEETARDGYRRRLTETPGVVATGESELGTSLVIREHVVKVPAAVARMMSEMRTNWETPCGELITEPVELWRHMRELACGFYYRWDPAPPADWLEARKNWKKYAREKIRHNRIGLDSEFIVVNWLDKIVRDGKASDDAVGVKALREWREIKDTFEINTVPEWVHNFALSAATQWISEANEDEDHPNGGIVWTETIAFGERLSEYSDIYGVRAPYFGAGMKASAQILDARGPVIASWHAHGEGKNLQHWSKNLFVAPPSSGKTWEQVLGRTHRAGQQADEVVADVWLHAEELRASFIQARADARYIEATLGSRQKLCYANINWEAA